MLGKTHVAIGITTSVAVATVCGVTPTLLAVNTAIGVGALGGYLPDIDHAGSTLGSKIPILPHLLKHRGVTHTVYFIGIIMWLLLTFTSLPP
ncbi:MAG: metal-dependent hydrolase [Oscillospiraceae bacterium]